ncbi:MAG: adenylate/guanylate cyclase domain-containing protein [Xanthobacteraceae bacterium]|jgi:adenylate cyclase
MDDQTAASQTAASTVLGDSIVAWLADEALLETEPAALYGELCQRLRGIGVPILRGRVGYRVLHPLYDVNAMSWSPESGVAIDLFRPDQSSGEEFLNSPINYALTHGLPVLRRRLTGETALVDFPLLAEFRALGGTDYLLFMVRFGRVGQAGIICSWLADRPSGFTDSEIAQLQRITRELAIALKAKIEHGVTQNIADAYLGKRAGAAVRNGSIRRGDGEKITAALWYSDLRRSTELADRLSADDFLKLLGRYFEMTAAAVLEHGGEVVSLIGDAVLGLFRVEDTPQECCGRALAAATDARRRLGAAPQAAAGQAIDFGIALHLGEVIYGNVGVPERLQFTLVGPAVNVVVRVQDLTKVLGSPLLATAPFAAMVPSTSVASWRPLGEHILRGFDAPMPILTI